MEIFEVIKYCVPALIVFATVYYLFDSFLKNQIKLKSLELQALSKDSIIVAKMQAYERLMLYCERINPYQMKLRLELPDMTGKQLAARMIIAIMQEYEHNVSQQLYVSPTLWKILLTVKDQTIDVITQSSQSLLLTDTMDQLMSKIDQAIFKIGALPTENGKQAIKREAGL
ncbi:MAG TPA: hypothetical protein PKD85_10315 [Saprospiraceae bacterium]|nr:hypothetical protein [Saprospiraceae bacterium]